MAAPSSEGAEDRAFAARRAALIAEAEAFIAASATATGVTLFIPMPNGDVETIFVPKRKRRRGRRWS